MKHIKTYETIFREIYKIDPNKEVVIRDKDLSKVRNIGKSSFWTNKDLPDKDKRIEKFRGRAGKMTYNDDDFFAKVDFGDEVFNNIPVHMLIHKDQYELEKNMKKYNL